MIATAPTTALASRREPENLRAILHVAPRGGAFGARQGLRSPPDRRGARRPLRAETAPAPRARCWRLFICHRTPCHDPDGGLIARRVDGQWRGVLIEASGGGSSDLALAAWLRLLAGRRRPGVLWTGRAGCSAGRRGLRASSSARSRCAAVFLPSARWRCWSGWPKSGSRATRNDPWRRSSTLAQTPSTLGAAKLPRACLTRRTEAYLARLRLRDDRVGILLDFV